MDPGVRDYSETNYETGNKPLPKHLNNGALMTGVESTGVPGVNCAAKGRVLRARRRVEWSAKVPEQRHQKRVLGCRVPGLAK